MPDPQLEQFCRIGSVAECRHDVFRRLQRYVRDEIQPKLDERDALLVRVAELEAKLSRKGKTEAA